MGNNISVRDIGVRRCSKKKNQIRKRSDLSSLSSSDRSFRSSRSSDKSNIYIDGRRYLDNSKYSLPNDDEEIDRLHMQHYVIRSIWQKNYCSPVHDLLKNGDAKVLDVGCGAATWLLEMAHDYPKSEFVGIDISPMYPSEIKPVNVKFEQVDVLEGLPYDDNTFDFVTIRNMITAFSANDWIFCYRELVRVTKPGGYIESSEFEIPALNRGPVAKRLSDTWIEMMKTRSIDITCLNKLEELFLSHDNLTDINHEIKLVPMATWIDDKVGKIMTDDMVLLAKALGPVLLLSWGITPEQYDELVDRLPNELNEYKTYTNIHVIYAQKKNLFLIDQ